MILEGDQGYRAVGQGATNVRGRMDRTAALVVQSAHAVYQEAVAAGRVHTISNLVAGIALGTAFSATPPLALWNPPSSQVLAVLWKLGLGYVSGTYGGGHLAIGSIVQATLPTGGAEVVPKNNLIGNPNNCSCRGWAGSTVTAPTLLRPTGITLGAFLATTAALVPGMFDWLDGDIVLAPGNLVALQAIAAAGTSPVGIHWLEWEEIPI
jgi:hypothetical protein